MNVIDRARERIERDGWIQGRYTDESGAVCIMGALAHECVGASFNDVTGPAIRALAIETREVSDSADGIEDFNDDPATSLEDVLLVMKKASARLDAES